MWLGSVLTLCNSMFSSPPLFRFYMSRKCSNILSVLTFTYHIKKFFLRQTLAVKHTAGVEFKTLSPGWPQICDRLQECVYKSTILVNLFI